jgi:hypothetical protein
MTGTLYFKSLNELAEFLSEFSQTGCTAEFEVEFDCIARGYSLTFTGAQ